MEENLNFDLNEELPLRAIEKEEEPEVKKPKRTRKPQVEDDYNVTPSCLRNEKIIVRHIPKVNGIWGTNPKHVLSGGMAEGSKKTFVVPKLSSGTFVNVLTDDEKSFLEDFMGLEYNALSIYKKGHDNFWDDSNPDGINRVTLNKQDNYLDLSDPHQYIMYKILLANKNYIAPNLQTLEDMPLESYQFVIISDGEEDKIADKSISATMQCYKEFGKIEDNIDKLRFIIEVLDGRPTSANSKLEFLRNKINQLILHDSKLFLRIITDPMLDTKVLIKKATEAGIISNRGGMLYLRKDGTPLCEANEEPTMNIAAKYLNNKKHLDMLFSIQAQLKD